MNRTLIIFFLGLMNPYICAQDAGKYTEFKYENGELSSEGYIREGKPDGYWKTYYPEGTLKTEGNRSDFMLDGVWKFYSSDGQINEIISYSEGKKQGLSERYKKGDLIERCQYQRDTLSGICEEFSEGTLLREIPFSEGKQDGIGYEFTALGEIRAILTYKEGFLRQRERINRTDKLGRKQGLWKGFYPERLLKSEGTYVDDEKNGLFKTFNDEGEIISLEKYENGVLITDAAETTVVDIRNQYYSNGKVRSSGSYKDGEKHGVHRDYDASGNITASRIYEYGKEVGRGIIGSTGRLEGPWKELYENGTVKEEGTYENGLRSGKWRYYHPSGKLSQNGSFRKGKPHGDWTWLYEDGSLRREESYRNGREDGLSKEYDATGGIISTGAFVDGLKDGEWVYRIGDHQIRGAYRDGEKHGIWIGNYNTGKQQFKGEFISGYAKGKHKFFYSSGQLMQDGKYSSGRKEGDWRRFDEDGEIILRSTFQSGIERRLEGVKISPTYEELEID